MSYLNRLSPETRAEVRKARKDQASEDKARRLERARLALQSADAKFRQPRQRDTAYLSWLRRAPCLVCAIKGLVQDGRTEAAHVRRSYPEPGWRPVGGAEKPSDFRALPLSAWFHRVGPNSQHNNDTQSWYADHGIYPPAVCAQLKAAQEAGADPVETIQSIAAEIRQNRRGA